MSTKSPYDILFEPVPIGPVTAPNRFYQVPHCNGMGHRHPQSLAKMRGVKAQGGWGVISTEEVEIHPTCEISPYAEGRIWDDHDIPALMAMTDAVHEHGSLAAIELAHNGFHAPNLHTRLPPMAPTHRPVDGSSPVQARAMDAKDITNLIRWHVQAAKRARRAGFDIIYVYAGHNMATLMHFMQQRNNDRTDAYGGSLENRVRLTREVLEAVKDAVGDTCGIAFRCAVDEMMGNDGIAANSEGRDIVEMLAEHPDLWDVNVSDWGYDSATARFEPNEGFQDPYTSFVKSMTTKPVVGVGRYTDADAMVSRIKSGQLDFIGAARPSIADPYLPNKIREGRIEEIRECIGCNICVTGDNQCVPMRCTQNPTVGEEWRRGWHPEEITPAHAKERVLVVGAGPAGLECALALGKRGYDVALAEAGDDTGGRLIGESALPGMASYIRVRDYRQGLLNQMANVEIYRGSHLQAADVIEFDASHVMLATGAVWRADGVGRHHEGRGFALESGARVLSPDDIMNGEKVEGAVVVYDDDHYYMGSLMAERLREGGCEVTLVTPSPMVSSWSENSLEQPFVHKRLLQKGVNVVTDFAVSRVRAGQCEIACVHTGAVREIACETVVSVTARLPVRELYDALTESTPDAKVELIGDALAPGTVAAAVYLGRLAAECVPDEPWDEKLFRRELVSLDSFA